MIEQPESEAYLVRIASKIPIVKSEEVDTLRKEIRLLKLNPEEFFGESFETYRINYVPGYKLTSKKAPNVSIDSVWSNIISDIERFPLTSDLLKATLSF